MKSVVWVLVNTNSQKEAEKIGRAVLKKRLAACFGLIAKIKSVYFWPPKTNQLETSRGPLLVLETLPKNYPQISRLVKRLHSDKTPFIGKLDIKEVDGDFYKWLAGAVK